MKHLCTILTISALLTSCVTHVSDAFFNKAEYQAYSRPDEILPDKGMHVLTDGKDYYIELQRIRQDNRGDCTTYCGALKDMGFYSIRDEEISGVKDIFRIPEQHALYITGQSSLPGKQDAKLAYMENAAEIKARCTRRLPICRALKFSQYYAGYRTVTSPRAGVYNALGYTTAVVADAPLSIVGTAASAAANVVIWPVYFIIYPGDACNDFAYAFGFDTPTPARN